MSDKFKFNLEAFGESILLSSISFSIASVEMSSKFSVKNFAKDNETLKNAVDALSDYMKIGVLWAVGCMMVLYAKYGLQGLVYSALMNSIILYWVYSSYHQSFKFAADKYHLTVPADTIF